jgi:hypothetical protein
MNRLIAPGFGQRLEASPNAGWVRQALRGWSVVHPGCRAGQMSAVIDVSRIVRTMDLVADWEDAGASLLTVGWARLSEAVPLIG